MGQSPSIFCNVTGEAAGGACEDAKQGSSILLGTSWPNVWFVGGYDAWKLAEVISKNKNARFVFCFTTAAKHGADNQDNNKAKHAKS